MKSMQLRVYRTFEYVINPYEPLRMGGPVHWMLKHTDELQVMNEQGEWIAVLVVEAERPNHPNSL